MRNLMWLEPIKTLDTLRIVDSQIVSPGKEKFMFYKYIMGAPIKHNDETTRNEEFDRNIKC